MRFLSSLVSKDAPHRASVLCANGVAVLELCNGVRRQLTTVRAQGTEAVLGHVHRALHNGAALDVRSRRGNGRPCHHASRPHPKEVPF